MKRNSRFTSYILLLAGLLLWELSPAQETSGELYGKISDARGLALTGASIIALHLPSGTRYSTTATANGGYHLPNLRIGGPYSLTVSFTGMQTVRREDIQVSLGDAQRLDITLDDSAAQLATATVSARRNTPRANAYGSGVNISPAAISDMPTISRSLTDLTRLTPQGSKDNSFGGSNFRYNNVTIDGAINNDAIGFSPSLGGITGTSNMPGSSTRTNPISLDAIEDMQVYLSPFDVRIGNFTGGSINAVTRSGTNTVSGSVYAYGRNATLTGKDNAGDKTKMPSDFYDTQVGFRVGFPLIKNKLFFFSNEEVTRRVDPILQGAGSPDLGNILSVQDAVNIQNYTKNKYGFDVGAYGQYNAYSRSNKFFNRLDWNINDHNQLVLRNNTITSQSINMERDGADFRFGSIAYQQANNQISTVAELKTRFSSRLSNSLLVGYTSIHDYRNPLSDPSFPQVQIAGRTPGSTIYFGTDREGAIFNQKQQTVEFTDNLNWYRGNHTFSFGTHNEFYHIVYGFVNSWNGRVDYNSIEDFLAGNPSRVRANYSYTNNDRNYLLSHPSAEFNINLNSLYGQDEFSVNSRLRVTLGMRVDMAWIPKKQPLSYKTTTAAGDRYFGTTYTYTPLAQITNNYFSIPQASPRIGFNYMIRDDKSLVLRGGTGLFTGRIPFAWIGYAFYNNGNTFGAFDQRSTTPYTAGSDPLARTPNGIQDFVQANGADVHSLTNSKTQVDAIDNHFRMPKVWRSSLALDYITPDGTKITLEGILTQTVKDVKFQQVNLVDGPSFFAYDSLTLRQPIFAKGNIDPRFSNAYQMSNTGLGYRYSLTAQVSKRFPFHLELMAAYTYGQSKDISNGIRNSMESNWQLNQALNPNDPGLAYSNFDIRHRIISSVTYHFPWGRNPRMQTTISVFFSAQSGSPFTWGFVNQTIQRTPQQVSLAYIPYRDEAVNFFQPYQGPEGQTITAIEQANAFNAFIDKTPYLSGRRGDFTERNGDRTPWNTQADLHLAHDVWLSAKSQQRITLSFDIMNLTNLLNPKWGWVYFVPNTFNSTASVGLTIPLANTVINNYPVYQFQDPGKPYAIDYAGSRYQMQAGVRYTF